MHDMKKYMFPHTVSHLNKHKYTVAQKSEATF